MTDFPGVSFFPPACVLSSVGICSMAGQVSMNCSGSANAGAVWPAANRAIYMPVQVENFVTVFQMSFQVAVQSGNYDIGIYDTTGKRLVSTGSTAVPVAGAAIANITDTALRPGTYYLALNVDNITASVMRSATVGSEQLRTCGVQQQAVGAVTLPATATFANPASSYIPAVNAHLNATV